MAGAKTRAVLGQRVGALSSQRLDVSLLAPVVFVAVIVLQEFKSIKGSSMIVEREGARANPRVSSPTDTCGVLRYRDTAPQRWWDSAVLYQVYLRSFADANGDGVGDIAGMISRLPYIKELGVDAVWISPWYVTPMLDGGYDVSRLLDVDPLFGSLDDVKHLIAASHELGLRVVLDMVANHCSSQHPWFQLALASPEGSKERDWFYFKDGRGDDGNEPPNDWKSIFGGPAWTRTQKSRWYPWSMVFPTSSTPVNPTSTGERGSAHALRRDFAILV